MARAGLDADLVVKTAAKLADKRGLDGVTLTSLAKTLQVRTPSLYNHIPGGLDGLRSELARRAATELGRSMAGAAVGVSGPAAVHALANTYRAFVKAHPGLYASLVRAPDPRDKALVAVANAIVETCVKVLAPFGLSGDDAIHSVRGLRALVHGFTSLELAGGFGLPLDLDESFRRLVDTFVAGLPRPRRAD